MYVCFKVSFSSVNCANLRYLQPLSHSPPQAVSYANHHAMGVKRARQNSVSSSEDPSTPYSREQSVDVKIVHLDAESAISDKPAIMRCSLPPHQPLAFDSIEDYEVHYHKTHVNRCSDCQNNFPDEHFLHLHIAENHDPISAARRERGEKTVGC